MPLPLASLISGKRLCWWHAFGGAHADVDQFLERGAVAEGGGVRVDEREQDVARAGAGAKGVEVVALDVEHGQLLGLNFASLELGSKLPSATPTISSPLPLAMPPQASSSTCELGSTPADSRNCSNWTKRDGQQLVAELRKPGIFARCFQVGVGEFSDVFGEHADHRRAESRGEDAPGNRGDGADQYGGGKHGEN